MPKGRLKVTKKNMHKSEYRVELSALKAVKYPVFAAVITYILKFLGIVVAGFHVQMPMGVDMMIQNVQLYMGMAMIIFIYDFLKHYAGVRLP